MSQIAQQRQSSTTPSRWHRGSESDPISRMQDLLDRTFGDFGTPNGMFAQDGWSLPVDIEEQDDAYVIEAEMPGVKREDVQIEQIGNELAISGEFKEKERSGVLRKQTRRTGQFAYRVVLPEQVDTEMVQAKLSDGVLTVTIPKSTKAAHKKIEITG